MEYENTCENCGKKFSWKKLHAKYTRKYCSTKCSYEVVRKRNANQFKWDNLSEKEKLFHLRENFEEKVIKQDGCWDWKGWLTHEGYAKMQIASNNKLTPAHRVSWMLFKGEIPPGLVVCHKCDNRKCTNPDHLFLGTNTDNQKDKIAKGRQLRGSKIQGVKLTENDVIEIKKLLKLGVTCAKIARDYKVTYMTISLIKKGKNWKWVEGE